MRRRVGHVRQLPSGRYEASVSVGSKVDGTNRRMYKTFDDMSECDEWLSRTAVEMGKRPELAAGKTLRGLWSAFEAERTGKLANSTLSRYRGCMERRILPVMGDMDVSRISVGMVQSLIDEVPLRNEARQCKAALSSVLTWAVRHDVITENPIRSASFVYPGDTIHAWENEDVWDDDPFAAIEGNRNVWGAGDVMRAFPLMRGIPLEPVWLCMVGAGLRMEEAFAVRRMDVRRVEVNGTDVTQIAVHHAENPQDGRHRTKSRKSRRIVAMLEPFGERLWEIAQSKNGQEKLCNVSPNNQQRGWRKLFDPPKLSKHLPKKEGFVHRGVLDGIRYIPLSRMRATHETLMQEAGVLDSINAAMHGHSEKISYKHYQTADAVAATQQANSYLKVVG